MDYNVDAITKELQENLFDEVLQALKHPKPSPVQSSLVLSLLKGEEEDAKIPVTPKESSESVSPFLEDKHPVHHFPVSLFALRVDQLFSRIMEALPGVHCSSEWRQLMSDTATCSFCSQFQNYPVHDRGSVLFHRFVCEGSPRCSDCCVPLTTDQHRCGLLCPFCEQVYSNQSSLSHHIRALHAVPFCRDCYEPDVEPFRQFCDARAARHHVMRVHAREPLCGAMLACPTCGKLLGTLELLRHFREDSHRELQCVKCCCRLTDEKRFLAHASCLLPPSKRGSKTQSNVQHKPTEEDR